MEWAFKLELGILNFDQIFWILEVFKNILFLTFTKISKHNQICPIWSVRILESNIYNGSLNLRFSIFFGNPDKTQKNVKIKSQSFKNVLKAMKIESEMPYHMYYKWFKFEWVYSNGFAVAFLFDMKFYW